MLVLSRKVGERILIGEHIAITVVRIGPNTVRLGIDAPRSVRIAREELHVAAPLDEDCAAGQSCREHEAAVVG